MCSFNVTFVENGFLSHYKIAKFTICGNKQQLRYKTNYKYVPLYVISFRLKYT